MTKANFTISSNLSNRQKNWLAAALLVFLFIALVWLVYTYLPVDGVHSQYWGFSMGVDWRGVIRSSSLATIHGQNPYDHPVAWFPPWIYIIIAPIAILPLDIGVSIMAILSLFLYGFILYQLNVSPVATIFFLISPVVLFNSINGNLDAVAALGLVLPPQVGLFLLLAKPQIGLGPALFILFQSWRMGGIGNVARIFLPVIVAYLFSFIIYGFWPLRFTNQLNDPYNTSLGALAIPIGVVLLIIAIRKNQKNLSMISTPLLAPYINFHSWAIALLGLNNRPLEMIAAVLTLWVLQLLNIPLNVHR